MKKEEITRIFPMRIRKWLENSCPDFEQIREIRMRSGQPLYVYGEGREFLFDRAGVPSKRKEEAYTVTGEDVRQTLEYIANYSLYAFEDEIRQGFLTVPGGHRIGIAGKTVIEEGKVKQMKQISCLNIRVAHQKVGCADKLLSYLWDGEHLCSTLIISPPGGGKTTLLRDLIRQISDGSVLRKGMNVGVVDERSEIAACYQGIPQNDVGSRTDVMDCCPKAEGMMMLLRSMAPQVLAVDEIGGSSDLEALMLAMRCGCRILATVHGESREDLCEKPLLVRMQQQKMFQRYVLLQGRSRAGEIKAVYDGNGGIC